MSSLIGSVLKRTKTKKMSAPELQTVDFRAFQNAIVDPGADLQQQQSNQQPQLREEKPLDITPPGRASFNYDSMWTKYIPLASEIVVAAAAYCLISKLV